MVGLSLPLGDKNPRTLSGNKTANAARNDTELRPSRALIIVGDEEQSKVEWRPGSQAAQGKTHWLMKTHSQKEWPSGTIGRVLAQHCLAVAQDSIVFERQCQLATIQGTPVAVTSDPRLVGTLVCWWASDPRHLGAVADGLATIALAIARAR